MNCLNYVDYSSDLSACSTVFTKINNKSILIQDGADHPCCVLGKHPVSTVRKCPHLFTRKLGRFFSYSYLVFRRYFLGLRVFILKAYICQNRACELPAFPTLRLQKKWKIIIMAVPGKNRGYSRNRVVIWFRSFNTFYVVRLPTFSYNLQVLTQGSP